MSISSLPSGSPQFTESEEVYRLRRGSALRLGLRAWLGQDTWRILYFLMPILIGITAFRRSFDTYDDAYVTFRYAYNLATGHGYVYNLGERYLGTSAPLFGIVLGWLGVFSPMAIPAIGVYLSGVSLFTLILGIGRLTRAQGCERQGLLIGLVLSVHPFFPHTYGGEMLTEAALVVWAIVMLDDERPWIAGGLLGGAVAVRPDALLAVIAVGGWEWVRRRRFPSQVAGGTIAVVLPCLLAEYLYYGSLLPGTFAAKSAQTSHGWTSFLSPAIHSAPDKLFLALPRQAPISVLALLIGVAALLGILKVRATPTLWPLMGWIGLQIVAFQGTHLPFYHWYYVPLEIGIGTLAGLGLHGLLVAPERQWRGVGWSVGLAMASLAFLMAIDVPTDRVHADYRAVAEWIETSTPANSSVGYCEIGLLGFYSHRRLVDPLGLVNKNGSRFVKMHRIDLALQADPPTYILDNPRFAGLYLDALKKSAWFRQNYRWIHTLPSQAGEPMGVYERMPFRPSNGTHRDVTGFDSGGLESRKVRRISTEPNAVYAINALTTWPWTSVSRKSRPWYGADSRL